MPFLKFFFLEDAGHFLRVQPLRDELIVFFIVLLGFFCQYFDLCLFVLAVSDS